MTGQWTLRLVYMRLPLSLNDRSHWAEVARAIEHQASVRHLSDGWMRWQARCTCGWHGPRGNQRDAAAQAAEHEQATR
jgi:hypothetical protein